MADTAPERLKVGVVLFDGFEVLDVFGPLEVFGIAQAQFDILMLGERSWPVKSAQGPCSVVDETLSAVGALDIILVPGGAGTRTQVGNVRLLGWLRERAESARYVASVCTGAALLAKAGILDGRRATTNKLSFKWVTEQGPSVAWVRQARWVKDGKFFTSSGVAAGIDMALALFAELNGNERTQRLADAIEYERHQDPSWDPFAKIHGVV